jgi:hypothetical protein
LLIADLENGSKEDNAKSNYKNKTAVIRESKSKDNHSANNTINDDNYKRKDKSAILSTLGASL